VDRGRPPGRDRGWRQLTVDARWIADGGALAALLDEARHATAYALDTEFHRERTYYAQLALVQLAWDDTVALIDPLAVDVAPLAALLEGPGVAVMHAASQDLEILEQACGTPPAVLFDTQVAAGFLGHGTPGLAPLMRAVLGVELPKADRLTDWRRRPLDDRVRDYAVADVAHLLDLASRLRDELSARGRLAWAEDECELVRQRHGTPDDPARAWWRVKDLRSLRGRQAAVAQSLAAWRERRAAAVDRPVRTVLPDLALVALAQRSPRNERELAGIRGLDGRSATGRTAEELLAAIEAGRQLPLDELQLPPTDGADRSRRAAVTLVSAWVGQLARELKIEPSLLATRNDVELLLANDQRSRLLDGWRAAVVGEPARSLAAGDAALAFGQDGELRLERRSGVEWTPAASGHHGAQGDDRHHA
jgi:ribonuclease D